ncbi:MAG: ribonuclease HI [Desulfocapsaceae bacterium]|nr:ribonuclease HI [Desulfocapsaceae bacterium]
MAKKKWYAVKCGKEPGIYTTWAEAEVQVKGFPKARFKGFATKKEAESWLSGKAPVGDSSKAKKNQKRLPNHKATRQTAAVEEFDEKDKLIIHTDGGALNNPGPGGYGVVIQRDGEVKELCGGYRLTTNNRMELMACIVALREVNKSALPIILYSDSSYVVNGIRKGWAKSWRKKGWLKADGKPALNQDLWSELLDWTEKLPVTFRWVKGHAGNPMNERCDKLAVSCARGSNLGIDRGYEGK